MTSSPTKAGMRSHRFHPSRGKPPHTGTRGLPRARSSAETPRSGVRSAHPPHPRPGPLSPPPAAHRGSARRPPLRRGDGGGRRSQGREGGGRWAGSKPSPTPRAPAHSAAGEQQPRAPHRAPEGPETRPRWAQPAAPCPCLGPLAPRPHPSPPAAPRPTRPKPLLRPAAARGMGSLEVSPGLHTTSERPRSRAPVPVLSSALPCSAGDGPPSCMLTLRRHFREGLCPGGCPACPS